MGAETFRSGAIYVRAVSRPRNVAGIEQRSELRGWLRGSQSSFSMGETVSLNSGELPVGGPAVSSTRRSTQQAAESSALLELQRHAGAQFAPVVVDAISQYIESVGMPRVEALA